MTLKSRLHAYIALLHVLVGVVLFWQREAIGWWLFPFELLLLASLAAGIRWVRIAVRPNDIAGNLAEIIGSREFGTRYPPVGQKEIDRIIDAYNRMLEHLQREWLRLGEQRGFLEQFLKVTPVGIVILDFDGLISLANPRARSMLGLQAQEDLTGMQLGRIDAPVARELDSLCEGESRMIAATGGRRLRCRRSSFVDRGFRRTYLLIEELTAELNRSERQTYEKLIRMISHEVTNTVTATNSLLESCRTYASDLSTEERRCDYENALDVLITRNRNLNEFTRGFSDLVKLPEPNCEPAGIGNLISTMETIFRAELARQGIALRIDIEDGLPDIRLDRNQIEQVLINVVKNAVEAIGKDGEIVLSARRHAGSVFVDVSDSGAGLEEQARNQLFTPFYTTKSEGQGLGLTVVREILTQHGFGFALERLDGRTRFRIEMPSVSREIPPNRA